MLNNQEVMKHYVEEFIKGIGNRQRTHFNLKVLIEVYSISDVKDFELESLDSFSLVFNELRRTLQGLANGSL